MQIASLYCYLNIYNNPLCILNNAGFNIIDIPVKDKFVDILDYSCGSYL